MPRQWRPDWEAVPTAEMAEIIPKCVALWESLTVEARRDLLKKLIYSENPPQGLVLTDVERIAQDDDFDGMTDFVQFQLFHMYTPEGFSFAEFALKASKDPKKFGVRRESRRLGPPSNRAKYG